MYSLGILEIRTGKYGIGSLDWLKTEEFETIEKRENRLKKLKKKYDFFKIESENVNANHIIAVVEMIQKPEESIEDFLERFKKN